MREVLSVELIHQRQYPSLSGEACFIVNMPIQSVSERIVIMKIPKRIASAIINSLKGGVVPRIGLPYITVGREQEINALLHDVDIIADGGASFRFIVGKYGSGKSFLLHKL